MRTKSRSVKCGTGDMIASTAGIVLSYFIALIITPFLSKNTMEYLFKFWATFIGLAMILFITGGLLGVLYFQKKESEELGDTDERQ